MSGPIDKTEEQTATGFSENAPASASREPAPTARPVWRLKLGPGGRVVIPAAVRKAMNIEEGESVTAILEQGELRLIGPDVALRKVRKMLAGYVPEGESLVDGLIRERRREAREEDRG